jgi:hypothetical protein
MSKIQKLSNSSNLNIWGEESQPIINEPVQKEVRERRKFEKTKSAKMNNSDMINSRGDKFLSAGMGTIKDVGSSSKFIGAESQNSIWDTNIVEKLAKIKGSDEISKEEKQEIQKYRNGLKQESLTQLAEGISGTDTRKDATITSLSNQDGSSNRSQYRMPTGGISIFDKNMEFDRIPEKTSSDIARKEAQKDKPKDRSWGEKASKQVTSKDLMNRVLDNLLKGK